MTSLFITLLTVFAALSCVFAEVPRCLNDNHVFALNTKERIYGSVVPPSTTQASTGVRSLRFVRSEDAPVTAGEDWTYIVDPSDKAEFSFTVQAYEGDTLICEAALTYAMQPTLLRDLSFTCGEPTTVTYAPGEAYDGEFTFNKNVCPGAVKLIVYQPTIGTVVPYASTRYAYSAPAMTEDATTHIAFDVQCVETNTIGCSGYVTVNLHEESPACQNSQLHYTVLSSSVTTDTPAVGNTCNGESYMVVRSSESTGKFDIAPTGTKFTFTAPATQRDALYSVRIYCDYVPMCDAYIAFSVLNTLPETTTSTTTTTTTTTSSTTTTTAAPLENCKNSFTFKVPTGGILRSSIQVGVDETCDILTYSAIRAPTEGKFSVNIIGEFLYQAPTAEMVETTRVKVSCVVTPTCITSITFVTYLPTDNSTDTTSTTTTTTAPALPACANVYYYSTAAGVALSSSLNGVPGQDPCVYGRYFILTRWPQAGSIELLGSGEFSYIPPTSNGNYDFKFTMTCLNKEVCKGSAYLEVTAKPPTTAPPGDNNNTPIVTNPKITCKGSCMNDPWLTYPNYPMWDNSPGQVGKRKDGRGVDSISARWTSNALVFTVYSLIGNFGVRFPTFEAITSSVYFESKDVLSSVAETSPAFEVSCLDNQGRGGLSTDVWSWTSLNGSSGTGTPGPYYALGTSWYQKFGGKHNQCDTFANSCSFAPLLTPSNRSIVSWTIDVNDCDATWEGVIPYNQLGSLKTADGKAIWKFVDNNQIKGTLLTEAVRPHSLVGPGRLDTNYNAHDIIINLEQFVGSKKLEGNILFSVDTEFFTYVDAETKDFAFGVNLLVHPFVTPDMETSYSKDRHVVGFKWAEQTWSAPDSTDCPTCTGDRTHCTSASQLSNALYKGEFPAGDCPAGTGRVHLTKGPATTTQECPSNVMHVYNQSGFSPTTSCLTSYQNITIRGVVPGSGKLTVEQARSFHYEGTIKLELLTDDGQKHKMDIDLTMYVSRLSQDLSAAEGGIHVCRSGSYWPVLDPLGTSIPDQPLDISYSDPTPLCVDDLSSSYGPSDWALLTLNLPNRKAEDVTVNYIYVVYQDTKVYLYYRDEKTGASSTPPASAGQWWQHTAPFLAFRALSYRADNLTTSSQMASSSVVQNVRKAFMFMPGAMEINGDVEIVVSATIQQENATGPTTFRRIVHVDPLLTLLSRQGPAKKHESKSNQTKEDFYAIGVVAGVTVVLVVTVIFFMLADNNRPLPKWIPRGKLVKQTVFSVLPGGKKKLEKVKPVVHKDMYDAMKSGKY